MIAFDILALMTALHCASPDSARCSCIGAGPWNSPAAMSATAAGYSDVVDGRVIAMHLEDDAGNAIARPGFGQQFVVVKLAVRRRWREAGPDTLVVRTVQETTMCGFTFAFGERYLVFARRSSGHPYVDKCSPTVVWSTEAQRRAELLGSWTQPVTSRER